MGQIKLEPPENESQLRSPTMADSVPEFHPDFTDRDVLERYASYHMYHGAYSWYLPYLLALQGSKYIQPPHHGALTQLMMYSNEHFSPPPAHLGIPPVPLDPKTGKRPI